MAAKRWYALSIGKDMKYWREILILILTVILVASVQECGSEKSRANANYKALTDTTSHFKNRLGTITASRAALQLTNSELKQTLLSKDDSLNQLSKEFVQLRSVVKFSSKLKLPAAAVKFETPIPGQTCDSLPLAFERSGAFRQKWFQFYYSVTPDSLKITDMAMNNTTTVITGVKRKWFLGKQVVKTDVTHSNPYISTQQITSAEVVVPEPWYKKWYLWLAAGIAGGLLIK